MAAATAVVAPGALRLRRQRFISPGRTRGRCFPFVTVSRGDAGSSRGPVSLVTRRERKVIVILTNPALIDRISADRRRIKILQHNIPTMSTNKNRRRLCPTFVFLYEESNGLVFLPDRLVSSVSLPSSSPITRQPGIWIPRKHGPINPLVPHVSFLPRVGSGSKMGPERVRGFSGPHEEYYDHETALQRSSKAT